MKLFVSATNVETGQVRVFDGSELTADMVMASACLPTLYQAVEIDGEAYWDGGYMGNPVLFPFFYTSASSDILIVQINPIERKGVPRTSREILDRDQRDFLQRQPLARAARGRVRVADAG